MPERRTVYVPDRLAARMATFDENWSEVAQVAWSRRCDTLERSLRVSKRLEDLRKQRRGVKTSDWALGLRAGMQYAERTAEYSELRRAVENADIARDDRQWEGEPDSLGWASMLGDIAFGEGEWGRSELESFCDQFLDAAHPPAEAVRGFILGMAQWFGEHRSEIEE